jgi:KaiC/GvpD/RAD55 family RecA-like ATPase
VTIGPDVDSIAKNGLLKIADGYSLTSKLDSSNLSWHSYSLKVQGDGGFEQAFIPSKLPPITPSPENLLRIVDTISYLSRFEEEKTWRNHILDRMIPYAHGTASVLIVGITSEAHSVKTYRLLEAAADGVIEIKSRNIDEHNVGEFIRIKSRRDVEFSQNWHSLKVQAAEITMDKIAKVQPTPSKTP